MSALPGASLYILFPGFGPHRSHTVGITKTRALYMYLIWENVGRKGALFFFLQLQPIKHMGKRSKTHVICMGKLPYRRIDLVNVSPSGSGKCLPGPAVRIFGRYGTAYVFTVPQNTPKILHYIV